MVIWPLSEYHRPVPLALSICIPTYNRKRHLENALRSVALARRDVLERVEICVSDNASTDGTADLLQCLSEELGIRARSNDRNLGMARNFLEVVGMARGKFIWMLGDDDLLLPHSLASVLDCIDHNPEVDFFYINSSHLRVESVLSCPHPFDVRCLPEGLPRFSTRKASGPLPFHSLIDPAVSFDFLGGIFLSVFRRSLWSDHISALDPGWLDDPRTFSHLDNTFPHCKIFSRAFSGKAAYFHAAPLSVCLTGAREWAPLYPVVRSLRIPELLSEYRRYGLSWIRNWGCRNVALSYFFPDAWTILSNPNQSRSNRAALLRTFLRNAWVPGLYASSLRPLSMAIRNLLKRLKKVFGMPS